VFTAAELQTMLRGSRRVDAAAWRAASRPHPPSLRSPVFDWLWEVVGDMSEGERRQLLRFWTGSSTPPLGGFRASARTEGSLKVMVSQGSDSAASDARLPRASTCDL